MIRKLLVLAVMAVLPAAGSGKGEDAVRTLVQNYMNARNGKDAAATRLLFTDDADQLVSTGVWRHGINALVAGAMASSGKERNQSSITVEDVRFLSADIAIVDGRYRTIDAKTGAARNMWTTLVAKRTKAGWRIAAIRNMLPAPH